MSFKPDLNSLHECINFNSTLRDTSSSFPFSPRSTYGDSFRGHSTKARNSHDETYMRTLMKPGTAKGVSRTPIKVRESSRAGQRPNKRVDFSILDEGLSYRTHNNNLCQSQRSDVTEPEEKEEKSPKLMANMIHRINGRGEITRMSLPHPKNRIRTGSAHPKQNIKSHRDHDQSPEKPVIQDPIIEKFQNNYQRLRKNIVKLTAKQQQQQSPEKILDDSNNNDTGFITKLTPSSPIRYEGAKHSLIIKSEDPKAPYVSDIEKTLQTDVSNSPRKQRFTYRKPSINTRPEVETISTLQSPKALNLQGVKPFKVFLVSEDPTPNAKKSGIETPQRPMSVQRAHKKVAPYDSGTRQNSTSGDEMPASSSRGFQEPRKIAAMFPKDTEYCRMRSIRNYIIQKKNLHFYSFAPKEYLNYKAIASMIAQGNANITVIPQETFASSFYATTPRIDVQTNTGTKWFSGTTKELESDIITRSLVLGPPEKKKPVLMSTRPGTTQDRIKARREQQEVKSSSPIKERVRFISPGKTREKREKSHNFKKGLLLPREIDNFELEGWDHKTEESV